MKDLQRDAEDARMAREEMATVLREVEKRCRISESELQALQQQLDAALSMRRQIENERDDLYEQLHGSKKG